MRSKGTRGQRRSRAALACGLLLCGTTGAAAGGWCDLIFKDVADRAEVIVLARYDRQQSEPPALHVLEVLKGRCDRQTLELDPVQLEIGDLKPQDRLILALTEKLAPVRGIEGMGVCTAINVLPIRGGKLRSKDRGVYDGAQGSMTLDQLRRELAGRPGA